MRSSRLALAAVALCLASPAARADGLAPEPRRWGLDLEGGVPEGLQASAVFRPAAEIRLFAGPAWNYIGWGIQGGAMLIPWQLGVSPFLSVEGGRYFSADASFLARSSSSGVPQELEPLLKHVSYDYAAAHVGIEVGARDGFAVSLRAGLAYVSATARGTATTSGTSSAGAYTLSFTDPHIRGTVPSVKLGVQLWF